MRRLREKSQRETEVIVDALCCLKCPELESLGCYLSLSLSYFLLSNAIFSYSAKQPSIPDSAFTEKIHTTEISERLPNEPPSAPPLPLKHTQGVMDGLKTGPGNTL